MKTDYFVIVIGVLQGDPLAPYLFIICLDYVLRTSVDKIKENGFKLTKERNRRYPAKTITDADYTDDKALLANAPAQAETLLHSLERAAAGIGLHANAHKTEYMLQYIYMCVCVRERERERECVYVCKRVCVCLFIYVCICMYAYIYIYIHGYITCIYQYTWFDLFSLHCISTIAGYLMANPFLYIYMFYFKQ